MMIIHFKFKNILIIYIFFKITFMGIMETNISDSQKKCGKLQKTTKKTGKVQQSKRYSKLYPKLQFTRRVGCCL